MATPRLKSNHSKLKVGIVCYPSIGGSGIVATNLGNELGRLGHQVHFISYESPFRLNTKSPSIHFHKVHINRYELFKYPDYTLPLAVAMGAIHKKYKLDVLHVHYAVPHATAALLFEGMMRHAKVKPPHIVTTLHGTDITLLAKNQHLFEIIKYSVERSCCVTAVSKYLALETKKTLKTKKPIQVIYNFFIPNKVTKNPKAVRKSLGLKANDFVALHMSNLRPVKRIPGLLKITSRFKDTPHFKLVILAGGDFTPYKPLVKKLKIENQVIVKTGVLDIENYINAADIGLYTSSEESFGLSILETMSLGKPVIASGAGGVPEVVINGKTGILCPVGNISEFSKAVQKLMRNAALKQKMGAAAKQHARKKFSAQKIVAEYLAYYQNNLKRT